MKVLLLLLVIPFLTACNLWQTKPEVTPAACGSVIKFAELPEVKDPGPAVHYANTLKKGDDPDDVVKKLYAEISECAAKNEELLGIIRAYNTKLEELKNSKK